MFVVDELDHLLRRPRRCSAKVISTPAEAPESALREPRAGRNKM